MRYLLLALLLIGPFAATFAADEDEGTHKDLLQCDLDGSMSRKFGFWDDKEENTTELVLQQAVTTTGKPVSPDYRVRLRALDKKGNVVAKNGSGQHYIWRVAVHETGDGGIALSYAEAGGSNVSFLLTANEDNAEITFITDLARRGNTYQVPKEIDCTFIDGPNILDPKDPVDVSALSTQELITVIDSYIGRRFNSREYQDEKRLGWSEEKFNAELKKIGEFIVKTPKERGAKYEGNCDKPSLKSFVTAKDHTGQVLGYRFSVACNAYVRKDSKPNATNTNTIEKTWVQSATVYYSAKSVRGKPQADSELQRNRTEEKPRTRWISKAQRPAIGGVKPANP